MRHNCADAVSCKKGEAVWFDGLPDVPENGSSRYASPKYQYLIQAVEPL